MNDLWIAALEILREEFKKSELSVYKEQEIIAYGCLKVMYYKYEARTIEIRRMGGLPAYMITFDHDGITASVLSFDSINSTALFEYSDPHFASKLIDFVIIGIERQHAQPSNRLRRRELHRFYSSANR